MIKRALRQVATTLLEVAGFGVAVYGIALFCVPAALVVGGCGLIAAGVLLA